MPYRIYSVYLYRCGIFSKLKLIQLQNVLKDCIHIAHTATIEQCFYRFRHTAAYDITAILLHQA